MGAAAKGAETVRDGTISVECLKTTTAGETYTTVSKRDNFGSLSEANDYAADFVALDPSAHRASLLYQVERTVITTLRELKEVTYTAKPRVTHDTHTEVRTHALGSTAAVEA